MSLPFLHHFGNSQTSGDFSKDVNIGCHLQILLNSHTYLNRNEIYSFLFPLLTDREERRKTIYTSETWKGSSSESKALFLSLTVRPIKFPSLGCLPSSGICKQKIPFKSNTAGFLLVSFYTSFCPSKV